MAEEFTAKFKVDISDLKKNIAESNRQIKLAEAEFKAASAGMDDWTKSADGISAKLSQLDKTLAAQKSVLDSYNEQMAKQKQAYEENGKRAEELRAKLQELKDKGISETSKEYKQYEKALGDAEKEQESNRIAVEKLEISILDQQAAVGKTEKEIRQYNAKLEDLDDTTADTVKDTEKLNDATEDSADNMEDLKKAAQDARKELKEMAGNAAKKVEKAFIAIGAAVMGAVTGMAALVTNSAEAADELGDMSKKTGISTEKLQEYKYTADMAGTSLETITGAQKKLVSQMSSARTGTGKAADAFKRLGVEVKNADGTLRNTDDVFMDVIDALGTIENETDRDAVAMDIFGKSAQELNPLIKEGKDNLKAYADEAHDLGIIVSDEVVDTLGDTASELKRVRAQFEATKQNIAAQFAPVVTKVLQAVKDILSRVTDIIQDPRIKASIDKLITAFGDFADKALARIVEWLPKVADVIAWLVEHFDALALTVGGLWAIFKGVEIVESVITAFTTLKGAIDALKASTIAANTAAEGLNSTMSAASTGAAGWIGLIVAAIAAAALALKSAYDAHIDRIEQLSKKSIELRDEVTRLKDTADQNRKAFENTLGVTDSTVKKAQKYIDRLKELERQGGLTAEQQKEYNKLVDQIKLIIPGLNVELDTQTGLLKDGATALESQIKNWEKKTKLAAYEKILTSEYEKQFELEQKMSAAAEERNRLAEEFLDFEERRQKRLEEISNWTPTTSLMQERQKWAEEAQVWNAALENANAAVNDAFAAYNESVEITGRIVGEYETLSGEIKEDLVPATEEADGAMKGLDETMQATGKTAEELAEEHFSKVVSSVQDMFNEINTETDMSMKKIIETLKHNGEALTEYQENLRIIQERGASENVMKYLESLGVEQAGVIKLIAESTDKQFEKFTKQFDENTKKAEKAGKEWGEMLAKGVEQGVDKKLPALIKIGEKAAHAVADAFKDILLIASPSKLFRKFGLFTGEGYIIGLKEIIPRMGLTGERAATTVADKFRGGLRKLFPTDGTGAFRGGAWASAAAAAMNGFSGGYGCGSYTVNNGGARSVSFTQVINAPKTPSRWELYRQTRNLLDFKTGGA